MTSRSGAQFLNCRSDAHSDGSSEQPSNSFVRTPRAKAKQTREVDFAVAWPRDSIPIEIYEIITSYLTRQEVRNLRLVCSEFEAKVSAQYFRNVVVPFKSELYSNLTHNDHGSLRRTSSALFSNGMRIFESFGRHILRFALSLELDEDILAFPPIKPSQAAVPAFWGIYRWPHTTYHRYTDLEGLEQTADETDAMKEALKCLVKVTNIGLCCDAGLGFLSGPDYIARNMAARHPVFGSQNRRRPATQEYSEPETPEPPGIDRVVERALEAVQPVIENPVNFKRKVLHKMVEDAGYRGSEANEAIDLILDSESTNLTAIDFDERRILTNEAGDVRRPLTYVNLSLMSDFETLGDAAHQALVPASLTRAQKEMLLELEWAHRAMIQSYVIGLIDNSREGCFANLTTLTIAKIPSSHVYMFNRHELWGGLPSVTHVTLGIIADWRQVSKPAPGCVEDWPVSPVEAVDIAFGLLNNYIGIQENIESLHFEWICGGEFAPGTYQRNHYILPAPFFERPDLMTSPSNLLQESGQLLQLPHVRHLSLKNCWASPHVFLQMFRQMCLGSLEKLELESVSLSGPPTLTQQAPLQQLPGGHAPAANNMLNIIQVAPLDQLPANDAAQIVIQTPDGPAAVINPTPAMTQALQHYAQNLPMDPDLIPQVIGSLPQETLQQPDWLSWAGIIEHFSPGIKIKDILAEQSYQNTTNQDEQLQGDQTIHPLSQHIPKTQYLNSDQRQYSLKSMSFKSCGYVAVDSVFLNTRGILPEGAQGLNGNGNPHNHDFSPMMQRCRDKLLARIVPYLRNQEMFQLINAFGMDIGWAGVYSQRLANEALADGVEAGIGRFSGKIESSRGS